MEKKEKRRFIAFEQRQDTYRLRYLHLRGKFTVIPKCLESLPKPAAEGPPTFLT